MLDGRFVAAIGKTPAFLFLGLSGGAFTARLFAGLNAHPAGRGQHYCDAWRDLVDVAQTKVVLRYAIKCRRWTLYRHNSHALLLFEA